MDDAPEARSARLDRLDPGKRAEERRRDHGRDRDDDAGVVAPVTGIRVSATRTDDPRRPAPEAGRWPVRTFSEGKGGDRLAVRHAGLECPDGGGYGQRIYMTRFS